MKTAAKRLFLALVLFAAFTTFVPCRYSSYHATLGRLVAVVSADDSIPYVGCQCNQAWSGWAVCSMEFPCTQSDWGCGPMWLLPCTGVYAGEAYPDFLPW